MNEENTLPETEAVRSLLDQLLLDSQLYRQSKDYKELLDFVVRLRNVAPFNAMLLQVQKPDLSCVASAHDWKERFGRTIKPEARPLLILWPFGPVALVYDMLDTGGKPLPEDAAAFVAHGPIDEQRLHSFIRKLTRKNIECCWLDAGDRKAGSITIVKTATSDDNTTHYRLTINRNHAPAVQFATLAHELAHLFLGHLGTDRKLNVQGRPGLSHSQVELEAESVAYLVCARSGVECKSETYLANYVAQGKTIDDVGLYPIMCAAGQIEALLSLAEHTRYESPKKKQAVQQSLLDLGDQ